MAPLRYSPPTLSPSRPPPPSVVPISIHWYEKWCCTASMFEANHFLILACVDAHAHCVRRILPDTLGAVEKPPFLGSGTKQQSLTSLL